MKEIVHSYFKLTTEEAIILVQLNPETFEGLELIVLPDGKIQQTKRKLDEEIYDDLKEDGFVESSALEFNLYLNGVK